MRRTGLVALSLVAGLALLGEARVARACGGCFTPPPPPMESESIITDEKMVLSISMDQTTLYDQISYSGSPSSFAWVLPIKGTVTVGLSADVMFQVLNSLTATEVQAPPRTCPPPPTCYYRATADTTATGGATSTGPVTVTAQQQVGPYEAVQLHSKDGSALNAWLTQHGYSIPNSTKPVIDAYVSAGFDFLALKLIPGQGVQSMQPVRVTSPGAAPSLPLHMVAVGTGATTGITIWVLADGRWAPSNFPTFTIADSEIVWDWSTESSNYEQLRLAKEASFHGRGWQIESSLELNQESISQSIQNNAEYGSKGLYSALPVTPPSDGGSTDAGTPDVSVPSALDQLAAARADIAVLLHGISGANVRITRMRSDVAKAALTVDMTLEASSDQGEISNVHVAGQEINAPACPVYTTNGCVGTGAGASSGGTASGGVDANGRGGCSTTRGTDRTGTALGFLVALGGAAAWRARRKRRAA